LSFDDAQDTLAKSQTPNSTVFHSLWEGLRGFCHFSDFRGGFENPRASFIWTPYNIRSRKFLYTKSMEKVVKSDAEWKAELSPEAYNVLRHEGTERAGTSPLNSEKREGTFVCAGCGQPLFSSETKFESGTGWPSFYQALPGALETKTDFKIIWPRTEYHCSRCGGHQGHVFNDGPDPTGQRYCNNGVALKFVPKE
jgi:peptide-methionine (R)-S-oxide reductase